MRRSFQTLAIVIISSILWFAAFESISTYWIRRRGDPLDKVKEVLVADREFGWRQKANFNGKFLGISLKTNELGLRNKSFSEIKNSSKNILILGPSSTFGWGVRRDQTYSFRLEDLLKKRYPGIKINVINAGQIGFSSWQGLEFYKRKRIQELKADILIIAYGANDVDRFRFFYNSPLSDKEEFAIPKKTWEISLQNILNRSNFVNLLSRKVFNLFNKFSLIQKHVPKKRVSDIDFTKNFKKLIQLGKSNGSELILLTTAYELPVFNSVNPEIEEVSLKYFNTGKDKYEEKQYKEALTYLKKAVEIKPEQNEIYYYLSSCYAYLGDNRRSQKMFEKARHSEPKRIAEDIAKLNKLVRKIAEKEKEGIVLVNLEKSLALAKGNDMFIDPVHMSIKGHERIAINLLDTIYEHDLLKINKN